MCFKRILLLSDYPDLIKYQQVDPAVIRQLYTLLFLFDYFTQGSDTVIQWNDRSKMDYQHLWRADSDLRHYADRFLAGLPWDDIAFGADDLIVCHFDYDIHLGRYLADRYHGTFDTANIYALADPSYNAAKSHFKSVQELFRPGGVWEVTEAIKKGVLSSFKQAMSGGYVSCGREELERLFDGLLTNISAGNLDKKGRHYNRILILDDYKRSFFIGDSTIWVRFYKKILRHCGLYGEVVINCNNPRVGPRLQALYPAVFGKEVAITCTPLSQLSLSSFDLILVEGDAFIKFLVHLKDAGPELSLHPSIYTVFTLREEHSEDRYHLEFMGNGNHPLVRTGSNNVDKEIYVSEEEVSAADEWLEQQGIQRGDYLVILQNGSTEEKKVLIFDEFMAFICRLLERAGTKILLLDEEQPLIRLRLTSVQNDKVIFAGRRGLRTDMCLIASRYTRLVVGPCTGIFHLANGVLTYQVNNGIRAAGDLPFLLVYTGKQAHDEGYLPKSWWRHSLVHCVHLIEKNHRQELVSLDDSPDDADTFLAIAGEVQSISAAMLWSYLSTVVTL